MKPRTPPLTVRQLNEPSPEALKLAARELRKIGRVLLDARAEQAKPERVSP